MKDAKKIELAIKALTLVANVEGFDSDDFENYQAGDLQYGAQIALRHLRGETLLPEERECMKRNA